MAKAAAPTDSKPESAATVPTGDGGSPHIPGYRLSPWPGPFVLPPGAWLRQCNPSGACGIPPGLYRLVRLAYDQWCLIDMQSGTAVDAPMQLPHDGLIRQDAGILLRGEQYLEHWEALRRSPLDGVA